MMERQHEKPPLTPKFCQHVVVQSTPDPASFKPGADPARVTLFDLGIVSSIESVIFIKAVKNRLIPWQINDRDLGSSPSTTVQQSADSISQNAF